MNWFEHYEQQFHNNFTSAYVNDSSCILLNTKLKILDFFVKLNYKAILDFFNQHDFKKYVEIHREEYKEKCLSFSNIKKI